MKKYKNMQEWISDHSPKNKAEVKPKNKISIFWRIKSLFELIRGSIAAIVLLYRFKNLDIKVSPQDPRLKSKPLILELNEDESGNISYIGISRSTSNDDQLELDLDQDKGTSRFTFPEGHAAI